jgi:hypothetical protein
MLHIFALNEERVVRECKIRFCGYQILNMEKVDLK